MDHAGSDEIAGLRFLGVGGARSEGLGAAAAVLQLGGQQPALLIDCGHDTLARYRQYFGTLPPALFVTHVHFDHIGGLEQLHGVLNDMSCQQVIRLFVPAPVIVSLHDRVGTLRQSRAEARCNFWDRFQIIPVTDGFWHQGLWFEVFEARHHMPRFAWGLRLPGRFVYTGDTRPIPEVLRQYAGADELIFHDCALRGNPSHTGWDDIEREYEPALRERLVAYHYESATAGDALANRGARVARPGELFIFPRHRGQAPSLRTVA